jgi:hypothetical protein
MRSPALFPLLSSSLYTFFPASSSPRSLLSDEMEMKLAVVLAGSVPVVASPCIKSARMPHAISQHSGTTRRKERERERKEEAREI